ncbi:MAG: hypothetical protein VXW32_06385 [Myxococcota bacterium]|nr:hypothetical protein [Myxococcota bacterium]
MITGFVHHGRLFGAAGRPAAAGVYHLQFSLHGEPHGKRSCWTERHPLISVTEGGFFSAILGEQKAIKPSYFDRGPRYLSTRIVKDNEAEEECGPRTPYTGNLLQLGANQERHQGRLGKLEESEEERSHFPSPSELADALSALDLRVRRLEDTRIHNLEATVTSILERLDQIDGDGKRLDVVEDRVDDMDGPDGDIVDLIDRMKAVEAAAPQLFDYLAEESPAMQLEALEARIRNLERDNLLAPQSLKGSARGQ